jgi:hypothetical protein
MIQYYDPKYTGNQWYLPTKSSKLYSPMCKADIESRQTWYDNVTVIDMKNDINFRRKVAIRKYPSLRPKEIELFLRSSAPEYS